MKLHAAEAGGVFVRLEHQRLVVRFAALLPRLVVPFRVDFGALVRLAAVFLAALLADFLAALRPVDFFGAAVFVALGGFLLAAR